MTNQVIMPQALDANGDPVASALAYFYESGTTTPLAMYSDTGLSTLHDVPLEADSAGWFPQVFYSGATAVKVDVQTPAGASLPGYPIDPGYRLPTDTGAASAVTFSPITDNAATDVQAAIENENARIDAIEDAKTGADASFVSGTAGTAGNLAEWNADGDLVNGPDVLDEDDMSSDSASAVPTQQSVKAYVDAVDGKIGGVGQTWQDVSASRSANTSYQNTTGRPIEVFITAGAPAAYCEVSTDEIAWVKSGRVGASNTITANFTVPDQHYYRVNGSSSITYWSELR